MISIKTFKTDDLYFAARNSHLGFENHFDRVFDQKALSRLYILKGGPGTGKSTLMRGLVSFANERGFWCEGVLCSSDPTSLDGVIIGRGANRIAVIDGTAPHATDPKFPGAIDEIIDLGIGFDKRELTKQRGRITELSDAKNREYKSGYGALLSAKAVFDNLWEELHKSKIYSLADEIAGNLYKEVSKKKCTHEPRIKLYSAFGKDGYVRLPLKSDLSAISIRGEEMVCYLVSSILRKRLTAAECIKAVAPSALDDRLTDRIYTADTVLCFNEDCDADIDLSCYSFSELDRVLFELFGIYSSLLDLASRHFRGASEYHFSLEDIYKRQVDFNKNDLAFLRLCEEIPEYLY